jgi:hypothetical protein
MATRPTGQGPGRRPRRRHHTNRHDHEEKEEGSPAEAGTDADPASEPGSIAWRLTDPAIEDAIARFVATAPPLPEDLRARLARMLRTNECHHVATSDEHAV